MSDDGGSVYSLKHEYIDWQGNEVTANLGITRRDWLAGLVMQALLSNPEVDMNREDRVDFAYKDADAMIAEGRKEQK